jgi:hypothetical protein
MLQPTCPPQAVLYDSQPQNSIPVTAPAQQQPAEQQWQTVSKQEAEIRKDRKIG